MTTIKIGDRFDTSGLGIVTVTDIFISQVVCEHRKVYEVKDSDGANYLLYLEDLTDPQSSTPLQ